MSNSNVCIPNSSFHNFMSNLQKTRSTDEYDGGRNFNLFGLKRKFSSKEKPSKTSKTNSTYQSFETLESDQNYEILYQSLTTKTKPTIRQEKLFKNKYGSNSSKPMYKKSKNFSLLYPTRSEEPSNSFLNLLSHEKVNTQTIPSNLETNATNQKLRRISKHGSFLANHEATDAISQELEARADQKLVRAKTVEIPERTGKFSSDYGLTHSQSKTNLKPKICTLERGKRIQSRQILTAKVKLKHENQNQNHLNSKSKSFHLDPNEEVSKIQFNFDPHSDKSIHHSELNHETSHSRKDKLSNFLSSPITTEFSSCNLASHSNSTLLHVKSTKNFSSNESLNSINSMNSISDVDYHLNLSPKIGLDLNFDLEPFLGGETRLSNAQDRKFVPSNNILSRTTSTTIETFKPQPSHDQFDTFSSALKCKTINKNTNLQENRSLNSIKTCSIDEEYKSLCGSKGSLNQILNENSYIQKLKTELQAKEQQVTRQKQKSQENLNTQKPVAKLQDSGTNKTGGHEHKFPNQSSQPQKTNPKILKTTSKIYQKGKNLINRKKSNLTQNYNCETTKINWKDQDLLQSR